ncbi:MAG: DUF4249 domain-containing protein [Bacteroidota bacterium]
MKGFKQAFYLVLTLMMLSGCQQIVEVDLPPHEPQLVVNALMTAGKQARVVVSKSRGVTGRDTSFSWISDAEVQINVGGSPWEALAYIDSFETDSDGQTLFFPGYYSKKEVPFGDEIEINVTADLGEARSRMTIPPQLSATVDTFQLDVLRDASNLFQSLIRIKLENPPELSYYELIATLWYRIDGVDSLLKESMSFSSQLGFTPFDGNTSILLTNELLNGEVASVSLICFTPFRATTTVIRPQPDRLVLEIRTCSPEYYNYLTSYQEHIGSQVAGFSLFTTEPLPMYNNIEGGLGILAGYSTRFDTLMLQ